MAKKARELKDYEIAYVKANYEYNLTKRISKKVNLNFTRGVSKP